MKHVEVGGKILKLRNILKMVDHRLSEGDENLGPAIIGYILLLIL